MTSTAAECDAGCRAHSSCDLKLMPGALPASLGHCEHLKLLSGLRMAGGFARTFAQRGWDAVGIRIAETNMTAMEAETTARLATFNPGTTSSVDQSCKAGS